MYVRSLSIQNSSFFLLGPRGTGKSTWLKEHYKGEKYVNLLDERLCHSYLEDPGRFYDDLVDLPPKAWVIVDEIQRMPNLLNEVHRLMEERRLRFALTGSSARKLRKSGVNLLAGRAIQKYMYPLTPKELGSDFNLETVLEMGSLPLVVDSEDPRATIESYVQTYLKEEIKAEALVRNLGGFVRFLPVLALYHGSILNVSTTARDCGVSRTTVNGFLDVLIDTLLLHKLSAFESGIRVREKRHPKIYWADPGIVRAAKGSIRELAPEEKGSLLEGYIFMCLKMQMEYCRTWENIWYWHSGASKNVEVDFLLCNANEYTAIEVKACTRLRPEQFRGLKAIDELKNVRRKILVYLGRHRSRQDGVEVMPLDDFFAEFDV